MGQTPGDGPAHTLDYARAGVSRLPEPLRVRWIGRFFRIGRLVMVLAPIWIALLAWGMSWLMPRPGKP